MSVPLPSFFLVPLIKSYAKFYGVNLTEVQNQLGDFRSFSDFFVRDLVEDARPLGDGFVSPADGRIDQFGSFSSTRLIQAKGKEYDLVNFLGEKAWAEGYKDGSFITVYLSPADYHNVHVPFDSCLKEMSYIPGTLWPVNSWSVENIEELFSVNERVVFRLETEQGSEFLLVMVGATNVGSIGVSFSDFKTNTLKRITAGAGQVQSKVNPEIDFARGDKLGSFFLGSTVVLIFRSGEMNFDKISLGQKIKLGQTLGELDGANNRSKR